MEGVAALVGILLDLLAVRLVEMKVAEEVAAEPVTAAGSKAPSVVEEKAALDKEIISHNDRNGRSPARARK